MITIVMPCLASRVQVQRWVRGAEMQRGISTMMYFSAAEGSYDVPNPL